MKVSLEVRAQEKGPATFPETWASDWGEDEIGLWQALTFAGVRYAFRWIQPGTFMMGSSENEPARGGDETQHKVILTKGFWMGETTVTQALWQQVMATNPSHFKGNDLPVEMVSWENCQQFLAVLNGKQPELNLCLPTEAQWEYACRAGSRYIFHFGNSITTEQVNYNAEYPLKGSPKGEFRQRTVGVRELPANAWGLYQMHGNVWEWCGDWLGDYPASTQVDPMGPDRGRKRVVRGGSWFYNGRYCRAAYRSGRAPGVRFGGVGVRLVRGQKPVSR